MAGKRQPSAYMIAEKKRRAVKKLEEQELARKYCNAIRPNSGGARCRNPAGMGTNHPGFGKCKRHGGTAIAHNKHAAKLAANQLMGTPMDINPFDAIIWCIRITAG